MSGELKTLHSLQALADLVEDNQDLYLRWSAGPESDRSGSSRDELT